ncbi:MAG TPA: hypothetical protein VF666_02010 [Pyrinomonadaceae bacterium]|jgi:hypothetical protein
MRIASLSSPDENHFTFINHSGDVSRVAAGHRCRSSNNSHAPSRLGNLLDKAFGASL